MKIKKLLAALTALTMAASFAACGENDETQSGEADGTTAFAEEVENDSEEETTAETDAAEEEEDEIIEPTDEILEADMYSGKVQIGDHVFQMPIQFQDLIDAGATFKSMGNKIDIDSTVIDAGDHESFSAIFDGGKDYGIFITVYNNSDGRALLKDCEGSWNGQFFTDSIFEDCKEIIFPKGIRVGSTEDEMLEAFGEPTEKDLDRYYYESSNNIEVSSGKYHDGGYDKKYKLGEYSYRIDIDLETKKIKTIDFNDTSEFVVGTMTYEEANSK